MEIKLVHKIIKDFKDFFDVEERYLRFHQIGNGWYDLIYELCSKLKEMNFTGIVTCIKEKFGGLRFYVDDGVTTEQENLIYEFCNKSYSICEVCGEYGSLRSLGWSKTLCDKHYKEAING